MDRPAPPKAPPPPTALTPPTPEQVSEALRALRERHRASTANTVAGTKPVNTRILSAKPSWLARAGSGRA